MPTNPTDFLSLAQFILYGGGAVAIGWFISGLLDKWPWFVNLFGPYKTIVAFVSAAIVACIVLFVKNNITPATIAAIDPYVQMLLLVASAFFGSQFAYARRKKIEIARGIRLTRVEVNPHN